PLVKRAIIIPVDRDFVQAAPDHRAMARRDLVRGAYIPTQQPIAVRPRHVQILPRELTGGAHGFAPGVVESGPRLLAPHAQVREKYARDGSVRDAHPGVPGRDENVRLIPRVPADEGQAVNGLHDLPGPAEFNLANHWEPLAGPRLKPRKSLMLVPRLTGFVIF